MGFFDSSKKGGTHAKSTNPLHLRLSMQVKADTLIYGLVTPTEVKLELVLLDKAENWTLVKLKSGHLCELLL